MSPPSVGHGESIHRYPIPILLLLFVPTLLAYNVNEHILTMDQTPSSSNSLFGWSLQHFKDKFYIGAPLTSRPLDNSVYECDYDVRTTQTSCRNVELEKNPVQLPDRRIELPNQGDWMGGSLAASNDTLYACAFRQSKERYAEKYATKSGRAILGACYRKDQRNKFVQLIDFTQAAYKGGNPSLYGHWMWRTDGGTYGFSTTVTDGGNLVAGNPTKRNHVNDPHYTCGSLGEVIPEDGGIYGSPGRYKNEGLFQGKQTSFFAVDRNYITENQVSSDMDLGKMAGFSVARGKFLGHNQALSFVLGAPRADMSKGAVYLCTDCFGRNDRVTAKMKVDYKSFADKHHLKMGEEFGVAVAACDINGDRRDDLIVGAPGYSGDVNHYNTGRVHVFISTGGTNQWTNIRTPHTVEPTRTVNGARFGSQCPVWGTQTVTGWRRWWWGLHTTVRTKGLSSSTEPHRTRQGWSLVRKFKAMPGVLE